MKHPFWQWFDEEAKSRLTGRAETFALMFEYLDGFDRGVTIVETGCMRIADNWEGDGLSTKLFDEYVGSRPHGGSVLSVDIDPQATALCAAAVSGRVSVHTGDSVTYLKSLVDGGHEKIDLLYLDSFDLVVAQPIPAALHHMNELQAALPLLRPDTLVVVDDSPGIYYDEPMPHTVVGGKGMFVAKHAEQMAAEIKFHLWQIGWTGMVGEAASWQTDDVHKLVERARHQVEVNHLLDADATYRLILGKTTPPRSGLERVAHGEACLFYARRAMQKNKYGTACDWYREALRADPRATDYLIEMVDRALRPMGNRQIAQQEAYKATRMEPDNPLAWRVVGLCEYEMHNAKESIAAYDKQLALAPDDTNAIVDRIFISMEVADYDYSRELITQVITTDRRPDALHCLAMIAYREGRMEEAIGLYDQAIEAKCNNLPSAHWNKSLALHSIGRYREGWIEHEWRKHERGNPALSIPLIRFNQPVWTGKEEPPARIHVHAEAGMGDNIAMARYLQLLVDRGFEVCYETNEQMVSLMQRSFPMVDVVPKAADYPGAVDLKSFDYHLPIGSCPWAFETDIDSVPWFGPYLKPDQALVEQYSKKLPRGRRKIGVCWSSGIRDGIWLKEYGKRKSTRLDAMTFVGQCRGDVFVSLQVGPERAEVVGSRVLDLLPEKPTWDDTAALVECLDLVITVDTSIAHLAGAMGKPVWLMMHTEGSWHWMVPRPGASWNEHSPWYPSVRIFRQDKPYEWTPVVECIANELLVAEAIAAE